MKVELCHCCCCSLLTIENRCLNRGWVSQLVGFDFHLVLEVLKQLQEEGSWFEEVCLIATSGGKQR